MSISNRLISIIKFITQEDENNPSKYIPDDLSIDIEKNKSRNGIVLENGILDILNNCHEPFDFDGSSISFKIIFTTNKQFSHKSITYAKKSIRSKLENEVKCRIKIYIENVELEDNIQNNDIFLYSLLLIAHI